MGLCEASLSVLSVMLLLGAAVRCNLAVPAVILGALQSPPSPLSEACAVAGGDRSYEGATLDGGEAQTGNDSTYLCGLPFQW